ncbi:DUF2628 domain-containing protein [Fictibacillus iocasae]|uniref:DUF2628 domain-containing protein n=1 Tax=Fictibacillus iocasae TaxID=2715437 RepID=A0ABW2NVU3_9BACL
MVCRQCGVKRETGSALSCQQCGGVFFQRNYKTEMMGGAFSANTAPLESTEKLALFVGEEKKEFYFKKWEKERNKRKITWNWAAFFLGIFWLGYRKMYTVMAIFFAVLIVLDTIALFVGTGALAVDRAIASSSAAFFGLMGNRLYKQHAEKKISEITATYSDAEQQHIAIKKAGGTSWAGVGLTFLFLVAYIVIFTLMFMM